MATETLADSLLDDLDDLSDTEEDQNQDTLETLDKSVDSSHDRINGDVSSSSASIKKRFIDDAKLQAHLVAIESPKALTVDANGNDEGQYQLMTASNKFLIRVQNEFTLTHQDLVTAYRPKFPELDELLPNPIAYTNTIKVIQNGTDLTLFNDLLISEAKLTPNQIITLSVASSTTQGEPLDPSQLQHVNNCIEYMEQIKSIQHKLISFVETHMEQLAPNVSTLIGASLAARMIATAGGMAELCKIPSCNLQVIGQIKATSASRAGMGTSIASATAASNASGNTRVSKPHEGMLAECDLYHRVPGYLQRKALKVIAAKLALAIRCDYVNLESGRKRTNESGKKFRAEVERKFAKLEEPSMAPVVKALPKPDMETKKRRGGKRMRLLKEQFTESEMMKQANRRGFSTESGEYGDDAMGLTLGMLEKTTDGSGAIRHMAGSAGNKRKIKQANTKAARKKAAQMNAGGQTSGLASSMAFTPVQGLELVNPDAMREKVKAANNKWFSDNSGFQSALPKK